MIGSKFNVNTIDEQEVLQSYEFFVTIIYVIQEILGRVSLKITSRVQDNTTHRQA
jgi:hypothetical protein